MREQILDVPARQFITRDTVLLRLDALVFFRIVDPLSVYAVSNLPDALELLCVSSLRNIVASLTLDETFSSRGSLNTVLKRQLEADCARFGIVINRVCIEEVLISKDICAAMETQKKEERQRIATIITAGAEREIDIIKSKGTAARMVLSSEGEKHALIARATGKAQAKVIAATAEAECFAVLQDALKGEYRAADYMYACQYLAQWRGMAGGTDVSLVPQRGYQNVVEAQ
jgi:regulator of protease activity HflC (stomatin/prohibitin superfamily)